MGNLLSMGIKMQSVSSPAPIISINFSVTSDASNTGKLFVYQSIDGGSFNLVQTIQDNGLYTGSFTDSDQFYCIATHESRANISQRGQIYTSQNGVDIYGAEMTTSGTLPQSVTSTTTTVLNGNSYYVQCYFGSII